MVKWMLYRISIGHTWRSAIEKVDKSQPPMAKVAKSQPPMAKVAKSQPPMAKSPMSPLEKVVRISPLSDGKWMDTAGDAYSGKPDV